MKKSVQLPTRIITSILLIMVLSACASPRYNTCCHEEPNLVTILGYGTRAKYKNLSESEQTILAMRDAKEDAFRNLIDRAGVISIKYSTKKELTHDNKTIKSSAMAIDSSGKVQGVRLIHLVPIGADMYEAKIEADLNSVLISNHTDQSLTTASKEIGTATTITPDSNSSSIHYRYILE